MSWFGRALDALIFDVSPKFGARRMATRSMYEALSAGDRNKSFYSFDPTGAEASKGSNELAAISRDYVRNNPWAAKAAKIIANNTVGWGITPRIKSEQTRAAFELWAKDCRYGASGSFYGLQRLAVLTEYQSGEVFWVRRITPEGLKISVHEGRELDTSRDMGGDYAPGRPRIVEGVEFDSTGQRIAYWFKSGDIIGKSVRVNAYDVAHIFLEKRVGQVRGITDFSSVLVRLKEYDELEDAILKQQKVAACLGVFITDAEGLSGVSATPLPTTLSPGMVGHLAVGQQVQAVNPPSSQGRAEDQKQAMRAIAAGLGVTYGDLTGDFSAANFSTMRADRLQHFADIRARQWQMLIPQGLDRVWQWWTEVYGYFDEPVPDWTTPPMPAIDPEKEGLAAQRDVRIGRMTPDEMIEEAGKDPVKHWEEYAQNLRRLDALDITLDSDPRKTSQNGIVQIQAQQA